MIRVIIAEDHTLVRKGLRSLLDDVADIEVVGEAFDGRQALDMVAEIVPDVLVTDLNMPRLIGMEVIERVRALNVPTQVVVLSVYSDEEMVRKALKNGAMGYVLKKAAPVELITAIQAAHRKERYLSLALSASIELADLEEDAEFKSPFEKLTTRQREVLKLTAEGYTVMRIADELGLSVKTIEKHRANITQKLKVYDVAGLVRVAIKHGLVFLDEQ